MEKKVSWIKLIRALPILFSCSMIHCQNVTDSSIIEITLNEGTNMAVALSPDNKTLALDLQGTIWIIPATGGNAVPITDNLGDCHEPAWSPDGECIAFHSYRSGTYQIWTVRKNGDELRRITNGNCDDREPCWTPDGKKIIFSSDRNGNYDIWQSDLATGQLNVLISGPSNEYNPAISPDGEKIAFVAEGQNPGVFIIKDSIITLLYSSQLKLSAPSWDKNGDYLLFSAFERAASKLILVDIKNDLVKEITGDEDIFPFRASWAYNMSFIYTSDGKIKHRVAGNDKVSIIPFKAELSLCRRPYQVKQFLFDDKKEHDVIGITGPVISPDGNQVAFSALNDIFIQTINGPISRITNDRYVDIDPAWSPDGQTIAYTSDRSGKMEVWLHDLITGTSRPIDAKVEGNASMPVWSPDGQKIIFYLKDELNEWGTATLFSVDLNTLETKRIYDRIFVPGKPTFSPDGKRIALMMMKPASSRYREGTNGFLIIATENNKSVFIIPDNEGNPGIRNQNGPSWSPDGSMIAYIINGFLWIVPVNQEGVPSGTPRQLSSELADKISWTEDSKYILYMATDHLKKVSIDTGVSEVIQIDLKWKHKSPEGKYIIHAGRLFNGIDSTYIQNVDIFVDGNRIKDIRPHQTHTDQFVIDASGKVVIPGLFESHTHLHSGTGDKLGRMFLSNGITSVRETGADPYDAIERKESWAAGITPGPRLFTTGFLDGSRVYYGLSNPVINRSQMTLEMHRAKKMGFDMIKTYVRMSDPIQKDIIEEAHKIGLPVSSHELYPAAGNNIDAVEHFRGTSRRGYSSKQTSLNKIYDDVIQIYLKSGMTITPTIVMHEGFLKIIKEYPSLMDNKQFNAFYSRNYILQWVQKPSSSNYGPNFNEFQKAVCKIIQGKGIITAGTDSPFVPYGTSLLAELWLFVDGGLTPFQALQTATINAAKAVGAGNDLGSVEPGKLADIVIIDGDPLHSIGDLWNVEMVFKNGIKYTLDELLK